MHEIVTALLTMSDSQIDASLKPGIRKWSEPPKAIEILEVLDQAIHGSLASGFVVATLQALYDRACKAEGTTHEVVAQSAKWRHS